MRFLGIVGVVVGIACFAACSDGNAAVRAGDGRLVLELGGTHGSLRRALETAGIEPEAPRSVRAAPADDAGVDTAGAGAGSGESSPPRTSSAVPGESPQPRSQPPRVEPPPEPGFLVVTLGERQTLIHLARKHLGDANRFREILALNGWSEAESRRLAPGQQVKIPRPAARSSRR